jgi:alkyldihydroxyacetonephosphate synthase
VEPPVDSLSHKAAVSIDLREMGQVLEIDRISRGARIQGGIFGPALETQLKPHGLTLRHFPASSIPRKRRTLVLATGNRRS